MKGFLYGTLLFAMFLPVPEAKASWAEWGYLQGCGAQVSYRTYGTPDYWRHFVYGRECQERLRQAKSEGRFR